MNKDYIINTIKNNADAINSVKLNGEIFNIFGVVPENADTDDVVLILDDEELTPLTVKDLLEHDEVRFYKLQEI